MQGEHPWRIPCSKPTHQLLLAVCFSFPTPFNSLTAGQLCRIYFKCKVPQVLLEIIPLQQFWLFSEVHKEKVQAEKDFCPERFLRGRKRTPRAGCLCSGNCSVSRAVFSAMNTLAQGEARLRLPACDTETPGCPRATPDSPATKQARAGTPQSSGCCNTHPWSSGFFPSTQRTSMEVSVNDRSLSN